MLICEVDFLSSVGVDLEHFPKHIALVVSILLNLLLARVYGGFRGVLNEFDSSQSPTNGRGEQNCR